MEKITGKEIIKNMEYLIRLLHREWERSGRTKAEVSISTADWEEVRNRLVRKIQKRQRSMEGERLSFKQSMELSRENFILLRLAKKIKRAGGKAKRQEMDASFSVELDKEEYRLFSMLTEPEERECCQG
ncbi:hypothetical protein [Candidatus Merdisoma sp. JLR.KK006]|uniref:hypothetical protein n=1 Tax=Candidatus Merdisoma sp. JLR.KK006 TaxID=3112626 RepID=UPI002FEFFF57